VTHLLYETPPTRFGMQADSGGFFKRLAVG
jgi:hypothetical protein